jgi:tetratricopeptide (TPR) repeat protein
MAPEQASGAEVDTRSDQFAFCVTLHVALYGERPYPGKNLEDYLEALDRPVREPQAAAAVPSWVRRVILRGLSAAPEKRFGSMDELLAALENDPAALRRRWLVAGAVACLVAMSALGVRFSAQRKAAACEKATPSLADAWDDEVRRDARAAFLESGAPQAADKFDRASKALDAYGAAWSAMYAAACEDTRVREKEPEEVYRLRSDCLDRRKVELRALTSLFRRADAQVVDTAVNAAYGLPALSWCADVRGLRANVGLPDDPGKRAQVEEARRTIADANALALGDKNKDALVVAKRALEIAREASHEATEAEALYAVGWIQTRLVDETPAQASLADAAWTAMAAGRYDVVVRASAIVAYITGVELQRGDEARAWLARAKTALKRMGGSDELEAFVASREASILHALDHRPELALPLAERAALTYRRLVGVHPSTERELRNVGNVYEALGQLDRALTSYEESLAMCETLYGPDALRTGVSLAHVGDAHLKLGHGEQGTRLLERALAVAERNDNAFWTVAVLQDLTVAANRAGDPEKARSLGTRGLTLLEKPGASPVLVPASCVTTADALLALGRPREALVLCDRAIRSQEEAGGMSPDKVYEWDALRCRGEGLLGTRAPRDALAPLERSLALPRREWPGDLARARFALARALVEAGGDGARARALAEQAREELLGRERSAVDAWLAAHPP